MSHEFTLWHSQALANARQDNNHDLHKALRTYAPQYRYGFEACEQHYAGRITELEAKLATLAALVAKKDEALDNLAEHAHWGGDIYHYQKWVNGVATEALALTADSVEVVEVGEYEIDSDNMCELYPDKNAFKYNDYEHGKLYTIKVKP